VFAVAPKANIDLAHARHLWVRQTLADEGLRLPLAYNHQLWFLIWSDSPKCSFAFVCKGDIDRCFSASRGQVDEVCRLHRSLATAILGKALALFLSAGKAFRAPAFVRFRTIHSIVIVVPIRICALLRARK
jgi:hypothetical protein